MNLCSPCLSYVLTIYRIQPIPRTADNHILLASFENMLHDVTVESLHGVSLCCSKSHSNCKVVRD